MQDPLVELGPLLDGMALLDLKQKQVADLCLLVEVHHCSDEVEVVSLTKEAAPFVEIADGCVEQEALVVGKGFASAGQEVAQELV